VAKDQNVVYREGDQPEPVTPDTAGGPRDEGTGVLEREQPQRPGGAQGESSSGGERRPRGRVGRITQELHQRAQGSPSSRRKCSLGRRWDAGDASDDLAAVAALHHRHTRRFYCWRLDEDTSNRTRPGRGSRAIGARGGGSARRLHPYGNLARYFSTCSLEAPHHFAVPIVRSMPTPTVALTHSLPDFRQLC
jgi:hypothetical protein